MAPAPSPSAPPPPERPAAQHYWDGVLDPQNLERPDAEGVATLRLSLETEIAFAATPDFEAARAWLAGAAVDDARVPERIVDLGAGLGAQTFAFARAGHRVWAVDASLRRCAALRTRAAAAGVASRVACIVATAEALPFRDGSLRAVHTKAVLIHTDLPRAAADLARVLASGGRGAFVEPQPGNPFAWIYRTWFAPKAWKSITYYFDAAAQRCMVQAVARGSDEEQAVQPFYGWSFLAFAFEFAWPRPAWRAAVLRLLMPLDRWMFRWLPWTRRRAWFGLIAVTRPAPPPPKSPSLPFKP